MKKKASVIGLALALGLIVGPGSALAGGRGDTYKGPIHIRAVPFDNVHRDNSGATTQTNEPVPSCQSQFSHTYWYVFTPDTTAFYIATTVGSDFDTVEAIYTYDGSTFTPYACDDDSGNAHGGGNNESWLDVQLAGGTTYYFQVGSFSTFSGYLEFHLNLD